MGFEGLDMTIHVVVVDSANLPESVEFPPLETVKYSWEQYLQLDDADIAVRCWRADILVVLSSAINRESLEKMPRIKLLITAGEACRQLDQAAAQEQGVELLAFPEAKYSEPDEAQDMCNRISKAIDHYIRNFENNGVAP